MRTTKKIASLSMIIALGSLGAFAQMETEQEVSDQELEQFASAYQQVQVIDQSSQQEMVNAVEEEGLTVQRYNGIQRATQNPDQELDATDEEVKKYEAVTRELEKIQGEAQEKIEEKITEEGLTLVRYQEIASAIQASPELQQKVQEYLQG